MFSQHERQQLQQIERWFEENDPGFARSFRDGRVVRQKRNLRTTVIHLAIFTPPVLTVLAGLLLTNAVLILVGLTGLSAAVFVALVRNENEK
jgi:hypothetical protein